MKTTMVPAQVTTVEDKIAGNLSMQQLLLLIAPVFLSGAIYAMMPPFVHLTLYKYLLFGLSSNVFAAMAIRIRGNLIINWIIIIGRYNARPRYFVFNKNDEYLRTKPETKQKIEKSKATETIKLEPRLPKIPLPQMVKLQSAVSDSRLQLAFKADKKGGLNVIVTEVE